MTLPEERHREQQRVAVLRHDAVRVPLKPWVLQSLLNRLDEFNLPLSRHAHTRYLVQHVISRRTRVIASQHPPRHVILQRPVNFQRQHAPRRDSNLQQLAHIIAQRRRRPRTQSNPPSSLRDRLRHRCRSIQRQRHAVPRIRLRQPVIQQREQLFKKRPLAVRVVRRDVQKIIHVHVHVIVPLRLPFVLSSAQERAVEFALEVLVIPGDSHYSSRAFAPARVPGVGVAARRSFTRVSFACASTASDEPPARRLDARDCDDDAPPPRPDDDKTPRDARDARARERRADARDGDDAAAVARARGGEKLVARRDDDEDRAPGRAAVATRAHDARGRGEVHRRARRHDGRRAGDDARDERESQGAGGGRARRRRDARTRRRIAHRDAQGARGGVLARRQRGDERVRRAAGALATPQAGDRERRTVGQRHERVVVTHRRRRARARAHDAEEGDWKVVQGEDGQIDTARRRRGVRERRVDARGRDQGVQASSL